MRVLIIDKMHQSILPLLEGHGFVVDYQPSMDREQILSSINNYEGLIVRSKTSIDAEFLNVAKHLKFVARAGAGVDNVDMEIMRQLDIKLINAPEGNRDSVAEHTLGLILSLFNNIPKANNQVKNGVWDREGNRGVELKGKTVGVLGFGYMGQAVVERLQSFGCKILVYDLDKSDQMRVVQGIHNVGFTEFINEVEVLTIHIQLNDQNKHLINKKYLDQFKQLSYVINTSRGELLVLADLLELLENGSLKGAALDVLENEKLTNLSEEEEMIYKRLFSMEKVILSPHVAGWTFESYEKINQVLVRKIKDLL